MSDATIALRYDRAVLNVTWCMNGKRSTLRIGNANASSSFTCYISVDEIRGISKKPVSSSQTSYKCQKIPQQNEPKTPPQNEGKCLGNSVGHMSKR